MRKYYLGVEERSSMAGRLISRMHLLVERSTLENVHSIFERMLVVSQYGNFEADIEFRFESENLFRVINKTDGKELGQGSCSGPYDAPNSMLDTISIQQTKEKAISIFLFDGPRIFVGKTYYSLETGTQAGFAVEKCFEINKEKYDLLKRAPQNIAKAWQEIRFN